MKRVIVMLACVFCFMSIYGCGRTTEAHEAISQLKYESAEEIIFGSDVRTDEGSLIYNACARIALKLEEVYGDMGDIDKNMLPDTMDLSHLIRYESERGISYNYATCPIVEGEFSQEIEIGQAFVCGDYTYTVTELIDGYTYKLKCETEGTEANANLGELEPEDYIEDYLGGKITKVLTYGTDDEDTEVFRKRVLSTFESTAFGGNKSEYRKKINETDGVGGCKPKRRDTESGYINITIIDSDYNVPSDDLVKSVKEEVDPEGTEGEGDGLAPICHRVLILPAEGVMVNVSCTLTFDDGYSADTSRSYIEKAVSDYLLSLRKSWEKNEFSDMYVRISQIEARILSVEGVLDISGTTINGSSDNLVLSYEKIPVDGEVTINV